MPDHQGHAVLILALFISAPFHSNTLLVVIENKTTCIVLDEETPLGEGDVHVHVGAVQEAADAQAAQGSRKPSYSPRLYMTILYLTNHYSGKRLQ